MTNQIHILPEHIINKIAAGEVVERPASIVKELIENSIDARSSEISVIVRSAGKELIQVIDNGMGMNGGDAITSFERHATSKIRGVDDLNGISTLGFRGEALASIAAVSRVELKTKQKDEELGTQVKISAGQLEESSPVAVNQGTQISVKNLFYNVPARRAFLKSDATEIMHILRIVKRMMLSRPEIGFKFYQDQKLIFDLQGESLAIRVVNVLEQDVDNNWLRVENKFSGISIFGFAGQPEYASKDKYQQFLFLNGRFITNRNINWAIYRTYGEMIDQNTYPPFVIYLSVDPLLVDVNIHPTKLEARFANEKVVLNFIQQSLRKALGQGLVVPFIDSNKRGNQGSGTRGIEQFNPKFSQNAFAPSDEKNMIPNAGKWSKKSGRDAEGQFALAYTQSKNVDVDSLVNASVQKDNLLRPIWQFKNRYIFSEIKSGLLMIDQHRAHVRVLYEKIIKNENRGNIWGSQQLLFPQNIDLDKEDYLVFREIESYLLHLGFRFTEFSGLTISVEAIPTEVRTGNESRIILDIIHTIKDEKTPDSEIFDLFARSFSRNNAIKGGDKLQYEEMIALTDYLFACEQPNYTPDGRSIIVNMSTAELERKFK